MNKLRVGCIKRSQVIDFNRHIEIDNYLAGTMTSEESLTFETKLEKDAVLKQELNLQKSANLLVSNSAQFDLKNKLKNIHAQQTQQTKQKAEQEAKLISKQKTAKIILVAGIVIAAVAMVAIMVGKSDDTDEHKNVPSNETKQELSQTQKVENELQVNTTEATNVGASKDTTDNYVDNKEQTGMVSITEELEDVNSIDTDVDNTTIGKINQSSETGSVKGNEPETDTKTVDENRHNSKSNTGSSDVNPTVVGATNRPVEEVVQASNEVKDASTSTDNEVDPDPCLAIKNIQPNVDVTEPCFGGEEGLISIKSNGQTNLVKFSVDGGVKFYSAIEGVSVNAGVYEVVGKDENQCLTAMKKVKINYSNCSHIIQSTVLKYMELQIPSSTESFMFEVRNARSGEVVYSELIENMSSFTYKGVDQSNQELPLGNYAYMITSPAKKFIAKGQITIIK